MAESRADAAEARAGTAEARADAAEKRADISATEKKALEGKLMQTVDANLKVRSKRRGQQRPLIQRNLKRTRVSDIISGLNLILHVGARRFNCLKHFPHTGNVGHERHKHQVFNGHHKQARS